MFFSRALLAGLALVSFASAQTARVAFTSVPAVVKGGDSYNITWGGGDGTPVTITLRQGNPNDLDTVNVLADGIEGTSYKWEVSSSLKPADDYALQITQGQDQINYSGQFSLVQGDSTMTSSASGSTTTSMPSNSTTTMSLGSNSTMTSNNMTMSTTGLPRTIPTSAPTSFHTPTMSATSQAGSTSAPNSSGAVQLTSSAAFVIGVIGAVMFFS